MDLSKIFVALDYTNIEHAKKIVYTLGKEITHYKVGHPLYSIAGNEIIRFLKYSGKKIFLDMKYFDIPSVIINAVNNLINLEIDYFTVHSLAGPDLLKALFEITNNTKTTPLAVTVLTSIPEEKIKDVLLIEKPFNDAMKALIKRIYESGIKGIVCSPKEIKLVKDFSSELITVTPGIRLPQDQRGDQNRTMSPAEAFREGADFIVMGRSITEADDPLRIIEYLKKTEI